MISSRTPYRISILGGGNDTPDFYSKYGSYIIGFGLKQYVYVMANFITELDNTKYQAFYSFPERVQKIRDFKNPAIKGSMIFLENEFKKLPPLSLHINNTLPSSCGIASSSSLIVSILNAVYALFNKAIDKTQLAEYTNIIERQILKEPGGRQDPWWGSYGGIGSLQFVKNGEVEYNRFNLSPDFSKKFRQSSVLFYHSQRPSFEIAHSYNGIDKEKYKLQLLKIAQEGKIAFENEDLNWIINLLDRNWLAKKSISSSISNNEIDNIYYKVKSVGASMKVCGVGGGGAIYCICPEDRKEELISLVNLPTIPVDFDLEGSKIIYQDIQ